MKKIVFIFGTCWVILLSFTHAIAQTYTVLDFDGVILFQNKPVFRGQHLENLQHLVGEKSAFVCLLHPEEGKFLLTFEKGSPHKVTTLKDEHGELYELTVGDFIKKHTLEKAMGVRGFDYFDFFRSFSDDAPPRLLLIDQDSIPLVTKKGLKILPGNSFVACIYKGTDSTSHQMTLVDSTYLVLTKTAFDLTGASTNKVTWKLKFFFIENGKEQVRAFTNLPYQSRFLTRIDLAQIVRVFKAQYPANEVASEVLAHLNYFYGKCHAETVEAIVEAVLNEH